MADTFPEWFAGSNKMGERILTNNWHKSPLGSIENRPQNLLAPDLCLCLGGSLEIISEPGKATKAMLYAPVKDKEEKTSQSDAPGKDVKESRSKEQKEPQQKIRILLVDDHRMVRRGLRNMIEAQDDLMIIAEASDGREAVELARDTSPDVIVMDVNMPRMNGIEATREISSDFPQIRIIGLSLHKKEDVAHSMQIAGAFAYLTKDQAFETLCSTIRKAAGPENDGA